MIGPWKMKPVGTMTFLLAAEQMISGIRTLTEVYQTEMSDPAKRADRVAAQIPWPHRFR